jgi:hypothetical protein
MLLLLLLLLLPPPDTKFIYLQAQFGFAAN